MAKVEKKELQELLFGTDEVLDLAALDGVAEEDEDQRATEMLSFRIDEGAMEQLRAIADALGVGHTILARELLLAGLKRLSTLVEVD